MLKSKKVLSAILLSLSMAINLFPFSKVLADVGGTRPVSTVSLSFTNDVFVSSGETWSTNKYINGSPNYTALVENRLNGLPNYSNGQFTYDGVTYHLGPLGSVGTPNNLPNAVRGVDSNPIVMNVEDGLYSSIRFIANSIGSSHSSATVTISYIGDSTSETTGITRIASFRGAQANPLISGEYYLGKTGGVKATEPNNAVYEGNFYAYYITPNPNKIVDKITVNCSNAVVFAAATVGFTVEETIQSIESIIAALPDPASIMNSNKDLIVSIRNTIEKAKTVQGLSESAINPAQLAKFQAAELKLKRIDRVTGMANLDYTRDVYISTGEVFSTPKLIGGADPNAMVAMAEDKLSSLAGFSNGQLTFEGAQYQFGPLGSVGNPNNSFNAVHGSDGNPISINIKDGLYDSIRFIANSALNSQSDHAPAAVTVRYLDGSTSVAENITRIASYRADVPSSLNTGEYYLGQTGAAKANNPAATGTYTGCYYAYYITPDSGKIVDSISINCSSGVVYAVSTVGFNVDESVSKFVSLINGLPAPEMVTPSSEKLVKAIRQEINTAKTNGMLEGEITNISKLKSIEDKLFPSELISWEEYTVKDSAGNDITDLADVAGEELIVTAKIKNNTIAGGQHYAIITAIYSDQNQLKYLRIFPGNLSEGDTATSLQNFDIPSDATSQWAVKCFIFDSIDNIRPLNINK